MCGIAGYIAPSEKSPDLGDLQKMLKKLEHRGPNDTGIWKENEITLGYTRLSLIDLSQDGNQPFITEDKTGILVYNGEVYNHQELRNELQLESGDIKFRSKCDTETVLRALHFWGVEKAAPKLNGMFAFAYYDKRTRHLWLGRDRAGIKPLYFSRSNGYFVFGSEIKALLAHSSVDCRADLHSLTTYVLEKRLDRWTPFENITELEPGTLLKVSEDESRKITYYDPARDLDVEKLLGNDRSSFDYWVHRFEQLFPLCVESHLASDAPLAVMCSGGVDSSLITAYAKMFNQNIVAYVADVEGHTPSERDRAQQVCDHLGVELRVVPVSKADFLRLWPLAVYHNDEPLFFKQNVAHMAVAEAVHNDGYKALVCGEGADELFGGYDWQAQTHRNWKTLLRREKILFFLGPLAKYIRRLSSGSAIIGLEKHSQEPFLSVEGVCKSKLDSRYLSAVDGGRRVLRRRDIFKKLDALGKPEVQAFLTRSIEDFYVHLGTALKSNDKMNMAFSVESRVPFLDQRMIDFAAHLPFKTKLREGVSKPLLKAVASKHLPKELMYAKKIGFGIPRGMTQGTSAILKNGYLEQVFKWKNDYRDEIVHAVDEDSFGAFHLVSAEIWAQIYFFGKSPEQLADELRNATSERAET